MKPIHSIIVLMIIACLSVGTASAAKPSWAGKGKQQEAGSESSSGSVSEKHGRQGQQQFSARERELIRAYYRGDTATKNDQKSANKGKSGKTSGKQQRDLPAGLQKKLDRGGELPAGWQNKVAAGKTLDTELYEQSDVVPNDLNLLLDETAGAQTRRIGNKVIKIVEGDATIIDVIDLSDAVLNNTYQ